MCAHAHAQSHTCTPGVAVTSSPGKHPSPEGSLHHTLGGPILLAVELGRKFCPSSRTPVLWEMGLRGMWSLLTSAVSAGL